MEIWHESTDVPKCCQYTAGRIVKIAYKHHRRAHIWQFIAVAIFICSMVYIGILKVDIYKADTARIFAQEQTLRASASMVRAWKQSGNQCVMCH